MSDDQYNAALDLLRRLDPKNITDNLTTICQNNTDLAEDLLSTVDVPLTTKTCSTGKPFLCCDYNRDGDSYKSPYTGEYIPKVDDAPTIPAWLRKLEVSLNDAFDTYRELYFNGGLCSVYLWEVDEGFAGVVLIKKEQDKSWWDSIHVFEADTSSKQVHYTLTSTIILGVGARMLDLTGNLTRQAERKATADDDWAHIANIGELVEETESKLRSMLNEIYFGKMKDVVGDVRTTEDQEDLRRNRRLEGEVTSSIGA